MQESLIKRLSFGNMLICINDPLVSVIIPIYKVEKYLNKCVDSIVNQTYKNIEIILIDDGSPDGCPHMCDEWAKKDGRIRVLHKSNSGLSDARNIGIQICKGEYICFVDSDDWCEPTLVQLLLESCLENQVLLSVCGRYDHFEGRDEVQINKCPLKNEIVDSRVFTSRMLIGDHCDCSAWGKMYHRSLWNTVQFPQGRIYEDVAIMYKVVLGVTYVAMINKPLYHYFRHRGGIVMSEFSERLFDYPLNTRNMLSDISLNHPDIFEYACWSHLKALQCVLHKILVLDGKKINQYKIQAKSFSNEIKQYKATWSSSSIFNKRDRQLCQIYSCFFLAQTVGRLKRSIRIIGIKINN